MTNNNNDKKPKLVPFDVFGKYKPFEIVKTDHNTIVIQSQIISYSTKKDYIVSLMFDFEKVTDFEYMEERDEDKNEETKLHFTIENVKMELKEVDR